MNQQAVLHLAPLFAMLIWAAITDLRERKIRNWLTLSLMASGLVQSFFPLRSTVPLDAFLGLLVGFGIPFVLFAMGALGGGDVKLLAGVGAWIGPGPVVAVFCIAAIVGMIVVIIQALVQGRLGVLVRNSAILAVNIIHVNQLGVKHVSATGRSSRSVDRPLPYAVPVFFAVAVIAFKSYIIHGN